jgi:hypothetical protein
MTTTDNLDRIYLHYFKETFEKLRLEVYESSKEQIKFKNQVFRLQLLGDRGLVETEISPLHDEEQFMGIEMYNSLLTLRDYKNKLTETEKRRILGTRLDFSSQAAFLANNFDRLRTLLDKDNYKETLRDIGNVRQEGNNF